MGQITTLDDFRPHLTVVTREGIHIIPLLVFEKVIRGELNVTDIDGCNAIMARIIEEWLEYVLE